MAAHRGQSRDAILRAGYELIGELGYERATTALVCARAGVSSGTFFHYFPTKLHLLVGVLESAADDAQARNIALMDAADQAPREALDAWLDALVTEASDPRLPLFVHGIGSMSTDPAVATPLQVAAASTHATLTAIVRSGQRHQLWRTDAPAERLATWLGVVADGVLTRTAEDPSFKVRERRQELRDLATRLLADTQQTL